MSSYLIPFVLTLAACFGVQALALRASGGRTTKSESNFFSSVGRIQAAARGEAKVMLLGSSVTGRLPDRSSGYDGVANLGCDGGSAVDVLRAMDQGILPVAPWLVVEANYLHRALTPARSEVHEALRKPWFWVGMNVPALAAYSRPAAFAYSKLLERRIGSTSGLAEDDLGATGLPGPVVQEAAGTIPGPERELIREIAAITARLRERGTRTMFVWLPPGREEAAPPAWILEMARASGSPWWDLGQQAAAGTVTLTDGVHMAGPSAARTVVSLLEGISAVEAE